MIADPAAFLDLAARVEAAKGPTRELWGEAFKAVYGSRLYSEDGPEPAEFWPWFAKWESFEALMFAPAYLDAAAALMPEGWRLLRVFHTAATTELPEYYTAHLYRVVGREMATGALAPTESQARLAAILRARAAEGGE